MLQNPNMGFPTSLRVIVFFSCLVTFSISSAGNKITRISGFTVHTTKLQPYDWSYIRVLALLERLLDCQESLILMVVLFSVKLPPLFSSASIAIVSDVNLDLQRINYKHPKRTLPMICFRDGGPPLPDVSKAALKGLALNHYNWSAENIHYLQNTDQCYALQKRITFKLLYGEFTPGVYYAGLFNGIGPIRTQSKMVNSSLSYSYSANITVESCSDPLMQGQNCDQKVENLSDTQLDHHGNIYNLSRNTCFVREEPKIYSYDTQVLSQLTISVKDLIFNRTDLSYSTKDDASELSIMCYVGLNRIPDKSSYDYSADLRKGPLVIPTPRYGTWYFYIQDVYYSKVAMNTQVCSSVEWEMLSCPWTTDGLTCSWKEHELKGVYQHNPTIPLVYHPDSADSKSASFPLEPLLSKSSHSEKSGYAWTYFIVDTRSYVEGLHAYIQLVSNTKLNYEIYVRYGGLPTIDMWDISYSNRIAKAKNSSMVKLYDSSEKRVNLYILYAKDEYWIVGLRHSASVGSSPSLSTTMTVALKWSPNRCSDRGIYRARQDASGSISYHYCACDRDHGGFDCSINLVSTTGRNLRWTCLIASNAAAILPAFKALQQKAFADWVIFMCSGISSAFYHSCDVGCWCVLQFQVLQFMDFWMSFLAVVSTFLYLCNASEAAKRTMHTIASVASALIALTGATRSSNIPIVLSMGAAGLVIGWLIEFWSTRHKSISLTNTLSSPETERQHNVKVWLLKFVKTVYGYFSWVYVLLGFVAFTIAAISKARDSQNYWKLHSVWHATIYTAAFFFLCSKRSKGENSNDGEIPKQSKHKILV